MLFEGLVFIRRIKTWVSTCLCSRGYRRSTKIIGATPLKWYTRVPEESILLEHLENDESGVHVLKYKVWYSGEIYSRSSDEEYMRMLNTPAKSPWVWIGGNNIDATQMLSHYLLAGNTIKLELLQKLEPSVTSWTYVDYETLDSVNFPSNGILIE